MPPLVWNGPAEKGWMMPDEHAELLTSMVLRVQWRPLERNVMGMRYIRSFSTSLNMEHRAKIYVKAYLRLQRCVEGHGVLLQASTHWTNTGG